MNAPVSYWIEQQTSRDLVRWAAAALLVAGLQAGAAVLFLNREQSTEIGDESDVVTVELAPIDSTLDATARDVAPAPQTTIESKAVPQHHDEKPDEVKVERQTDEIPGTVPLPEVRPPAQTEQAQPPAPRTAAAVKGGAPHIEASWETSLMRLLQRAKRYPPAARSRNEQGIVMLRFSVDRNGHVRATRVVKSSGHAALDNEAIAMIARIDPLPPFPASMPAQRVDVTVPIGFSLR